MKPENLTSNAKVERPIEHWNGALPEFNYFKNITVTAYCPAEDRFVFVNGHIDKIPGCPANEILNGGKKYWLSLVLEADRKRVDLFLCDASHHELIDDQNMTKRLNYRLINSNGLPFYISHEQRYVHADRLLIINTIMDISEKMQVSALVSKLNSKLHPDSSLSEATRLKDGIEEISHREHEVLQLIATGLSSKEIANRLFISNHTAISHRKNLIEKFNVKNTAELIKEASKVVWLS